MSTDRETAVIVRSWLDHGVTALPERVLDAVLDRVPATPQRRPRWPARRVRQLNSTSRIVASMAAVVVVVVVGISLIASRSNLVGQASAEPTTAPTASSAGPTRVLPASGSIVAGRYAILWQAGSDGNGPRHRISFTIPDGWLALPPATQFSPSGMTSIGRYGTISSPTLILGIGHLATDVVVDACAGSGTLTYAPVGPTVGDLINALVAQGGTHKRGPVDVTVAGYQAKRLVVWMTSADPCTGPEGRILWVNGPDRTLPNADNIVTDSFGLLKDGESTVYVIDVDGQRLVIGIEERGAGSVVSEVDGIISSLAIDPAR